MEFPASSLETSEALHSYPRLISEGLKGAGVAFPVTWSVHSWLEALSRGKVLTRLRAAFPMPTSRDLISKADADLNSGNV